MTTTLAILLTFPSLLFGQDTLTTQKELPRLEIPEVTIVGKKAITLPFARKGEVLDVELYPPPPPDTSVLAQRPMSTPPVGSFPRFRETTFPVQGFVNGMVGNFGTVDVHGTARYSELLWETSVRGGFTSTQGHTRNADAEQFVIGAGGRATIDTDNELLNSFRAKGEVQAARTTYKVFGLPDTSLIERDRTLLSLQTMLSTIDRVLDINLGVRTISLDDQARTKNEVSAVEPSFAILGGYSLNSMNFFTQFQYSASLLDYPAPVESPTYVSLTPGLRWNFHPHWSAIFELRYAHGASSDGTSAALFSPSARFRWNPSMSLWVSFWFEPSVNPSTFVHNIQKIPYLTGMVTLRHERVPVRFGTEVEMKTASVKLEGRLSIMQTTDTPLPVADNGLIHLEYAKTQQWQLRMTGTGQFASRGRIIASANIQYAHEDGRGTQLTMVPVLELQTRGEWSFSFPVKVWASLNYTGPRTADRMGLVSLGGYALLNIGASSSVIPSTLLSVEAENLLGTSYEWWKGYAAPGTTVSLRVQWEL